MFDEELISVIVPIYNVKQYLKECLDSIVNQTYTKLEILLIDDGSTDGSGAICDVYAQRDDRIKVCHKKNGGVSIARNTGLDMATGAHLIFVDADDWIHPQLLESYRIFEDKSVTVLCDYTSRQKCRDRFTEKELKSCSEYMGKEQFMEVFCNNYINSPVNKYYKTSIIQENGIRFPENMNLGEDLVFNLHYQEKANTSYFILHKPFYYYRDEREDSLSNSKRENLLEIQKELFASVKNFLFETGIWTPENADIYYRIYWDRLYLTWKMAGKINPEMLKDEIWECIWKECEKRRIITWKGRVKKLVVDVRRILV